MALSFDSLRHRYSLDGVPLPCVSELTRFISRELYKGIPERMAKLSAQKSSVIDKAVNELEKTGSADIHPEYSGYIRAYMCFLNEHRVTHLAADCRVHRGTDYAGTFDRLSELDGRRVILKITSLTTLNSSHKVLYRAALSLYKMAAEEEYGSIEGLFLLQLKGDGSYLLEELPEDKPLAEACILLHSSLTAKGKRKERSL